MRFFVLIGADWIVSNYIYFTAIGPSVAIMEDVDFKPEILKTTIFRRKF